MYSRFNNGGTNRYFRAFTQASSKRPAALSPLTAALLDRNVADTIARRRTAATLAQKQDLAAIIHLCGAGAGDAYARRGFRLTAGQQCGDHPAGRYLAQVNAMKRQFARLSREP